jgi:6-phosphogluconolactonase (cycloisomerase 2 family)
MSPSASGDFVKTLNRLGAAAVAAAVTASAAAAFAAPASASAAAHRSGGAGPAVFVQTDNLSGNTVVAYDRHSNGHLTRAGTYPTGGLGGALDGSVVDHTASQGSLTMDRAHGLLFAVNAGSNTLTVFAVHGDTLHRRQVISSGGTFPVSVAVHGDLVYALNGEDGGSVQGYRIAGGRLQPISHSTRPLNLDPTATPQFTNTPGQVLFSPNGAQLLVTTKANGSDIDVFAVHSAGRLSIRPVVNSEPGTVPFGITFDAAGHLAVSETGPSALATFHLLSTGRLTQIDAVGNSQAALCWVARAGRFLYVSNAGSATETRYSDQGGQLTLLGNSGTDPGTVDAAATPDGHFLYVQTGANGIVDEFRIGPRGGLVPIGSVTVAGGAAGEGISAG